MRERPTILVYVVVGFATLALIGAALDRHTLVESAGLFAYFTSVLQGISFTVRTRTRSEPAVLLGHARTILAVTLAAVAIAVLGNAIVVGQYAAGDHGLGDRIGAGTWAIVIVVLCWRLWVRPAARRAGLLHLIGIVFALPGIVGATVGAMSAGVHYCHGVALDGQRDAALDTTVFITIIVLGLAGPVLDKLFAALDDKTDALPEASVHV